ncbi:MAG: hypothetical protein HY368_00835 [Candidatus Aenigmarchaeota archaeon]|nr:hypothetical protein [Candidatus Aenigmarchaeota archaeon]
MPTLYVNASLDPRMLFNELSLDELMHGDEPMKGYKIRRNLLQLFRFAPVGIVEAQPEQNFPWCKRPFNNY